MASEYNSDVTDYLKGGVAITTDDEDRVLSLIVSMGSSYPSEIAEKLMLSIEQANAVCIKLINKELLLRVTPDPNYPQPAIRCRIASMRLKGVRTYEEFIRRSWVMASEKGFWYVADKFKGEHRRAEEAYIKTYPNIKYFNDFKL